MKTLTTRQLTDEFERMRRAGQYKELGNFFWDIFLMTEGNVRKHAKKLYDSLSPKEKELLE